MARKGYFTCEHCGREAKEDEKIILDDVGIQKCPYCCWNPSKEEGGNKVLELRGKYGTAKVFTDNIDQTSITQIIELLNQEVFKDSQVRIMPDVHAGKGCVIGFTANLTGKVIPNLVGVDIGCGVYSIMMHDNLKEIDFEELDRVIRKHVPSGFNVHKTPLADAKFCDTEEYQNLFKKVGIEPSYAKNSVGTLGGGNHFIEVNQMDDGKFIFNIHSGSRNLGHKVATYHQKKAEAYCQANNIKVPKHLSYLEGEDYKEYLADMALCQKYAEENRRLMMGSILINMKMAHYILKPWQTVHNFIDIEKGMIRKGAISANDGEIMTIPFNMRDGIVVGWGKGNEDWNCSAPHGAGRILSRSQAKKKLDLAEFEETMKGVFSTSIRQDTLDESPMAYKPFEEVLGHVKETMCDEYILAKPVYNFKA